MLSYYCVVSPYHTVKLICSVPYLCLTVKISCCLAEISELLYHLLLVILIGCFSRKKITYNAEIYISIRSCNLLYILTIKPFYRISYKKRCVVINLS